MPCQSAEDITREGFRDYIPDQGCEASDTCLTCPLLRCKHEVKSNSPLATAVIETANAGYSNERLVALLLNSPVDFNTLTPLGKKVTGLGVRDGESLDAACKRLLALGLSTRAVAKMIGAGRMYVYRRQQIWNKEAAQ